MIPIGKKGKILAGKQLVGWDIFVQDDKIDSGGYLILYNKDNEGYDDWVVDKEELERLFIHEGYKVEWEK